ncbi:sensory box protein [Asticcacaulis biprosthecium C19]|uniref:histidine kinase n=1 Tax=Asticcacaulis biprosthecium C19 TaxID=715226 RepID=F4QMT8_9CAUL|nr:ATP-binding protein [Asticcacaulis biprosthecium]EGF91529.1 sensory box protein [Asticcacaulis biprosthecium C19]
MRLPWGITVKEVYLAFFAVIAIALCGFIMVIYGQYERVQQSHKYTIYQYENIRQSRMILSDVIDMETGVRGFVLSGQTRFLQPYDRANARLRDEIFALRNQTYYEPTSFAETNAWLEQIEAIQTLLAKQVTRVKSQGRSVISSAEMEEEVQQMDRLRTTVEAAVDKRLIMLRQQVELVDKQRNNFLYILVFGAVLGVGILLAGTVLIIRLESEKEKAEDENRRAESRFLAVMNGVNDGLYELNFVNDSMFMSHEFKAMLGYDDDELEETAETAIALIHPDDVEASLEVRRDYITKKVPFYSNVFRMKHKDGTWRWILSRGIGTWDKFGQIRSLIGTHTDISEQKAREEDLRQLNADMEAFTYITSHDMRSPLVNLKGFSHELAIAVHEVNELLEPKKDQIGAPTWDKLETILKRDVPEALGFIGNAVDRMDTLTTAILDLSRIGKYVYQDEKVNARDVVDTCLGAQSYEISNKGVEVKVGALPELVTDRTALEQIFSNLIDNAVKYLRADEPGKIEITCHETGRDYIFSVRDNGRGIAPEDSDRVFNIFRRARNTGDVRGLGIGMAFVKASLRRMSGAIWFESALNSGTTFFFSLPKKTLEALRPAVENRRTASTRGGRG